MLFDYELATSHGHLNSQHTSEKQTHLQATTLEDGNRQHDHHVQQTKQQPGC